MKPKLSFLSPLLAGLLVSEHAYAYIDAGTGSMLVQLLVGGFAGIAVLFRAVLSRYFFSRKRGALSTDRMALEKNSKRISEN